MRLIEKEMLNAIEQGMNWNKDNTAVNCHGSLIHVYLHGNHIATVIRGSEMVEVNKRTLKQWATPTTKSRLRALGVDVCTRNHVTYLNGEAV
jgi:hypothetical protein